MEEPLKDARDNNENGGIYVLVITGEIDIGR